MIRYTFTWDFATVTVAIDRDNIVREATAPVRGFIGRDVCELVAWIRQFGRVEFERRDDVSVVTGFLEAR